MSSGASDVIVVGGGVVGCAVAWFLAREGVSVTLLERGEIAGEASGAAAGMLAPLIEADPETAAGRCFLHWGRRSLGLFPRLVEELSESAGVDPELRGSGLLRVARDAEAAAALQRGAAQLAAAEEIGGGEPDERDVPEPPALTWLGPEEARALEPQLAPDLAGALHSPDEAHVRSPLLVRAYAQAAARLGARIESGAPVMGLVRERARVVGVETAEGRRAAGQVVLCAGSWTPSFAAGLGVPLPITPVRGQIVSLDAPDPPFSRIVWGGSTYLVPKLDVGPLPTLDGLLVAAGHFRNGVLLSPATGLLVRDGVLGKGWAEPAFLPERWLRPAPSAG